MMRPARAFLPGALLALLIGTLAAPLALAQKPLNQEEWGKVKDKYSSAVGKQLDYLAQGANPPSREDETIIDLGAQYYAYFLDSREAIDSAGSIQAHLNNLTKVLEDAAANRPASDKFANLFIPKLLGYARNVIFAQRTDLVSGHEELARINETRLVALLAAFTSKDKEAAVIRDDAVALLADVLEKKDAKTGRYELNDGVLYYAAQGIGNAFGFAFRPKPVELKDQQLQQRCILDLLDLLNRPLPMVDSLQADQKLGLQFFRRQVIRSLASSRYPLVVDAKNPKRGWTAVELAKIVRNSGLTLEARWDERLEASIGLARMQPLLAKDYRPDCAAQHIGAFVVEFVPIVQQQQTLAAAPAAGSPKEDAVKGRLDEMTLQAYRLTDEITRMNQQLDKNSKELKALWKDADFNAISAYVKEFSDRAGSVLTNLRSGNTTALAQFLERKTAQVPSLEMYKGNAESVVKPGQPPKQPDTSEEPEKDK